MRAFAVSRSAAAAAAAVSAVSASSRLASFFSLSSRVRSALARASRARAWAEASAASAFCRSDLRVSSAMPRLSFAFTSRAWEARSVASAWRTRCCSSFGSSSSSRSPFFTASLMSKGSLTIWPLALHLISTSRLETILPVEATVWRTLPRSTAAVTTGFSAAFFASLDLFHHQ